MLTGVRTGIHHFPCDCLSGVFQLVWKNGDCDCLTGVFQLVWKNGDCDCLTSDWCFSTGVEEW